MRTDISSTAEGRRFALAHNSRVYLQQEDLLPDANVYVDYASLLSVVMDAVRDSEVSDRPLPVCLRSGTGYGKTELARAAAKALNKKCFTTQGSTDCSAQDMVVFPVPADGNRFDAVASGICTAVIEGDCVALFDEAGKVSRYCPESMTPLASLLDDRAVLWSDFLKFPFHAAPGFSFICTVQNNETLPDYITSRMLTFDIPPPNPDQLIEILKVKAPAAPGVLISAFRNWASKQVDITPRDAVLILHFSCRRMRPIELRTMSARDAMMLIQTVGEMVLARRSN